jgi:hypothetical protein
MKPRERVVKDGGLPTGGRVRGVITIIQEHRFRLEDELGRGYLFTLGWEAGTPIENLAVWSEQQIPVTVEYQGLPELGAVAKKVQRVARERGH